MLKKQFSKTSLKYCQDVEVIDECWQEIEQGYKGRPYHNLRHLDALYKELKIVKDDIEDWDALFYALCYHDIVYDVQRSDNELQSATLARAKLKNLNLPPKIIERISQHIIATKEHSKSEDSDSNLLIDADLAILGSGDYESYLQGIREEYACYSDREFYEGRRVALEYFLMQKQIYKSAYFFDRYEEKARWNLERELQSIDMKKIIKQEFKKSIWLGIGRAYFLQQEYPEINFSKYILYASLYNQAYDTQSEGDRAWYLWQLIKSSPQKEKLIDKILLALKREKEEKVSLYQLFSLAKYFVLDGNKKAHKIIYDRYKKSLKHGCIWCGESDIIELDGIDGVLFVAKIYGKAYMKDSGYYNNSSYDIKEYQEKNRDINVIKILKKKAKKSKDLRFYIKLLKEEESNKYIRKTNRYSYKTVKKYISKGRIVNHFISRHLTQKEIRKLAKDFLYEKELKKKALYLRVFCDRKFPYGYKILMYLAKNTKDSNNRLLEYSLSALKLFSSSKIRKFALDKLSSTDKPEYYVPLLIRNYRDGDEILLEQIVSRCDNEDEIHNLVFDYLEIYRNNQTPKYRKIFEIFYENMNCGIHRYDILDILEEQGVLSEKLKREMEFDSNEEVRRLFQEIEA
ncbi:MAG: hypothetical protein U9R27_05740 [Campylobacterota bacterium]|nr:hypothetical protein [Campylobacterota bacterium]